MQRAPRQAALAALVLGTLGVHPAGGQVIAPIERKPVGLLITSRPGVLPVAPGATITASFRVRNPSLDSLTVVPRIMMPAEWSVLLGDMPFALASRETDTWLVSVRVPARAPAGRYAIHLRAADRWNHALLADSLLLKVQSRRGIELLLAERPSYGISGTPYGGAFLVHNVGNVDVTVALRARSSTGTVGEVPATLALKANESRLVRVAATVALPTKEARDDVLELRVTDVSDSTVRASASTRLTIVQRAGAGGELHTVASTLRVRASDANAGVSRVELIGAGQLRDGGKEQLEFVMRAKPAPGSPFGEREEYHVGIRGAHFSTQLGDGNYLVSPLTSAGQRGAGGSLMLGDSTLGIGGFAQRFRFQVDGGTEQGASLRLGTASIPGAPHIGVNGVDRRDGLFAGQILSASGGLHPAGDMSVDVEYAGSHGPSGRGVARSARVGAGSAVHVDVGHLDADSSFAGPSHGSRYDYASINTAAWNALQLRGSLVASSTTSPRFGVYETHLLHTGMGEVSYAGHYAVGFSSYTRGASGSAFASDETQRGVTARLDQPLGPLRVWSSAEAGRAISTPDTLAHGYHLVSGGIGAQFGPSTIELSADASHGARMLRGAERTMAFGVDAQLQVTRTTRFTVSGTDTRTFAPDGGYTYGDARLSQLLPTGGELSARVRLGGRDLRDAATGQKLAYLEYSTPLQIPTGPLRSPGRVQGRVVDRQTGRGIEGALVRLGPQAAITDGDGRVEFAGLPAGAYRVSLAQQLSSGSTVFSGNPNVEVDSGSHVPTKFSVAVEPPGRISGLVHRMVLARTGIGGAPDSLADDGPMQGIGVVLAGARDTLYRSTDLSGHFEFTDVPSGTWTLIVVGDVPDQTQWQVEKVPVVLKSGGQERVEFRLVPRRRRVRIISGDGIDGAQERDKP